MACDFRQAHNGCGNNFLRRGFSSSLLGCASSRRAHTVLDAVKVHEGRTITLHHIGDHAPTRPTEYTLAQELGHFPAVVAQPRPNGRAHNRFLLTTIMGVRSWQELEALARTHSWSFNHVHVSALVCRLPKVVDPTKLSKSEKSHFSRFLREVSDLVTFRLSTFDPRAIANVLWGVSKLGYSPAPPLLNKFLFEAYVRMYDFNAQELANLAWALATLTALGNRPVPVWLRKYTLAALPRVSDLKPSELAHMAWALSKLFPQAAASSPLQLGRPRQSTSETQRTSSPVNGLALPSQTPASSSSQGEPAAEDSSDVQALSQSTSTNTFPSNPTTVPSVMVSSNSSNRPSANTRGTAVREPPADSSGTLVDDSPTAALQELVKSLASHAAAHIPEFRCGELVMAVMALHTLDPSAGSHLLQPVLPHLLSAAPGSLSPQDITHLWQLLGKCTDESGFGTELRMPYGNANLTMSAAGSSGKDGVSTSAASTYMSAMIKKQERGGAAASSLRRSTAGVAPRVLEARSQLGRHQMHALMDVTAVALNGFTAQGLCLLLWSWARLRMKPNDGMAHALFYRFCQVLPAQSTFQCVAISLWATAQLGLRPPPDAMELFVSCAQLQAPASKTGELLALLWGLQHLRYKPSKALLDAFNARLGNLANQLTPDGLQGVLNAYAAFGTPAPRSVRDRALGLATEATQEVPATGIAGICGTMAPLSGPVQPSAPLQATMESPASQTVSGASDISGLVLDSLSLSSTLLNRPPSAAVRYFATLAGVCAGVGSTGKEHRRVAKMQLQRLRWRLEASSELRQSLRAAIESTVQGRLQDLDASALCVLLATLVRLHLKPRAALMREVHEQVSVRVWAGSLTHWQAAWLLASLGRLHTRPPAAVLAQLLAGLGPYVDDMSDSQLLSVVEALVRLRFRPSMTWMQGYFAECMVRIDTWPAAKLASFLRSMAALGVRLSGSPCRQLQVVVYRRKNMTAGRAPRVGAIVNTRRARPAARVDDMKHSLCAVCSDLSGCSVGTGIDQHGSRS